MKKQLSTLLVASALFGGLQTESLKASPTYFPIFDPFTNATASGGTAYAAGATLAGQTNALGSYWYSIDSTATAANSAFLSNTVISYPGLPGGGGNALTLRNVAGPGARIFVATNTTGFSVGNTGNPVACYYSLVLQASNISSLSTVGTYEMGLGDQSAIANQTSQPGTVSARLYFQKVTATTYNIGISKQGNTTNYTGPFNVGDVLFVVVDYEGSSTNANQNSSTAHLWVNPLSATFGSATAPAATLSDSTGTDLTPFISCLQMYNLSATNVNQLLVTDFRMGTNWAWVTGGPYINQQPPAIANSGNLNLTVGALNNGSSNTFQWRFNGANLTDGPSISGSGATVSGSLTANLVITNTTSLDAGNYDVIVSNSIGAVTSTVTAASSFTFPVITVQPSPTNIFFYAGGSNNLTLSLQLLGLPIITNYLYSNSTFIAAATNLSFTLNNLQTSASFYAIASNVYGMATSSVVTVTVSPAPTAPYPSMVINDHPIGYWPLDESPDDTLGNEGKIAHDYIAANNGVYSNVNLVKLGYGPGIAAEFGYATPTDTSPSTQFGVFASTDSYVGQIPNISFASPNNAPSFSVEAWVNLGGSSQISGAAVVNKGYGGAEQFNLDFFNGNTWRFYVRNNGNTLTTASTAQGNDTNWHHLVGVLDAAHNSLIIYYDGKAQNSVSITPSSGILASLNPVNIGSRMSSVSSDFNDNFNGNIQDVAIYNYALTPAQVVNHYNAAGIGATAILPSVVQVTEGTTLSITATNSGTSPITYQWYDSTLSSPGTLLTGQTNATLVISNISAAAYDSHNLDVVVSNAYGQSTSAQVFIQVLSGPPSSLVVNPSSITLYTGVPAVFTVSGTGSQPFYFQWSTNGTDVPGATNVSFTNITLPGGVTIECVVTNLYSSNGPSSVTAVVTGVAAPTDVYSVRVLADHPTALWRLDEPLNSSTANDYVGGHDASYDNTTNGLPGFNPTLYPADLATGFGMNGNTANSSAQEVNNTGNGISLIDFATAGNAEFSVEMWAQESPQSADLLAKGFPNNTQFAVDTGGTGGAYRFVVHNAADSIFTASSASVLPDGNWHHIVGVADEAAGSVYLYFDGVRKATSGFTTASGLLSLANSTYPVIIGAQEAQTGTSFTSSTNAAMCLVAIYPYALSSNQVAAHYAIGEAGYVSLTIQPVTNNATIISWPATNGYFLQQSAALAGASWSAVTNAVTISGGSSQVTVSATNSTAFYRLAPQ